MREVIDWMGDIEITLRGGFAWLMGVLIVVGIVDVIQGLVSLFV